MQPINAKQRRKAFLIYTILYVFTTSVVVGLVYFNFQVPVKENDYLEKKMEYLDIKLDQQRAFSLKMNKVKSLIDTMDTEGVSREYIDQLISNELAYMRMDYASKDSSFLADMYNNVIVTYLELKVAKIQLQDLEDAKSDIDGYVETIDMLKTKLSETERELSICRKLSR